MPVSKNKIRLPSMTPGTARSIAWLRFGRAGARPKVYLQAAIHAIRNHDFGVALQFGNYR